MQNNRTLLNIGNPLSPIKANKSTFKGDFVEYQEGYHRKKLSMSIKAGSLAPSTGYCLTRDHPKNLKEDS